jgi:hypothetical protein
VGWPPRTFFKIVHSESPTLSDFLSNVARGRSFPSDPEQVRLWDGISVYDSRAQARRRARKAPFLGGFIAELRVPEETSIRYERTTRSRGHYTLWGDPATLLACVIRVTEIDAEDKVPS